METVYLISFFVGLGFAILSGLFSGVFGGDVGGDGGGDVGGGGDGHFDAAGGHDLHFPLLSPVTISTFVASFGGMGVIGIKVFDWPAIVHVPVATAAGLAVTGVVFYLFYKLFGRATVSSAPSQTQLVGLDAQVTVSIPQGGAGQISYVHGATRYTAPARTEDGSEVAQGRSVKIGKIVGGTFYVKL